MNKKFPEYKQLNLITLADDILQQWEENNTFQQSVDSREGNDSFVFYEGPPSANGKPGIHHVLSRTIKDIFCRFHTLKGKQVHRKAGWDTHGLPVELGVEKELGITKEDIGKKISVEEYNKACRKAVMRYTDIWNNLTKKIGYWVDLDNPYVTYTSKYMESVWWLLKQIHNKNLLYKGYTIQPYSPKAGTGLSSHELNMPGAYKDVTDTSVVAQFKIKKENSTIFKDIKGDVFFLAWTTTPWTLPSNTALTVGKSIEYAIVKTFNQYTNLPMHVVLAKNLIIKQFGKNYVESNKNHDFESFATKPSKKIPYQIVQTLKGNDLIDSRYHQLLAWALPFENQNNAFRVIAGDFVTTEDGTGIVHTAPTFGADDAKVAKESNVPPMLIKNQDDNLVPLVDLQGKFLKGLPKPFGGSYVKNEYYASNPPEKSTDVQLAILLKKENKAFKVEKYKHNYPHCWRTDKPILYYPLDSWFIQITKEKEKLVALNQTINWKPKTTGEGRFGKWLENANDWNLSRSRFWGIPLPIWRTKNGKEEICIGSLEELYKAIEESVAKGFMEKNPYQGFKINNFSKENYEQVDLHKNIVDQIILVSKSGQPMYRESDLIDVWFDSGSMPYAQWHYPFENKDKVENQMHPADFIAEGVDQTRGWFYTLHAISTLVFKNVAYKNVVSNGLVLDKNGQKMSKRLGNSVDPFVTLEQFGPDATRWYMIANAQPWENLKFDLNGIDEVRRKFFGTLYNTYSFFALYANVDGFNNEEEQIPIAERAELDQWILSELHSLIKKTEEFYINYEPTKAARAIQNFVTDYLSNWYVRLNRRRFWKGEYTPDKIAAYQTLFTVLEKVSILASPLAPFFMDRLYQDLNSLQSNVVQSVHLAYFPKCQESIINSELQERTHLAQLATSMVLSLRRAAKIKVRQPLQKIMIPVLNPTIKKRLESIIDLLKQEVNVKEVQLLTNEQASDMFIKNIKPNFKSLGPKYGKNMKHIAAQTAKLSNVEIAKLEKQGEIELLIEDETLVLNVEDFEITTKDIPGWTVATNNQLTMALDLQVNDELKQEGIARELVNKIQNIRKDMGLEVTDSIKLSIQKTDEIELSIEKNKNYICTETLASELILTEELKQVEPILINEIETKILIEKL